MPARKNTKPDPEVAKQRQASIDALDNYGLCSEDTVRFRPTPTGNWLKAKPLYVNTDGSVQLIVKSGKASQVGALRAIHPLRLEKLEHGPRGGESWVHVIEM